MLAFGGNILKTGTGAILGGTAPSGMFTFGKYVVSTKPFRTSIPAHINGGQTISGVVYTCNDMVTRDTGITRVSLPKVAAQMTIMPWNWWHPWHEMAYQSGLQGKYPKLGIFGVPENSLGLKVITQSTYGWYCHLTHEPTLLCDIETLNIPIYNSYMSFTPTADVTKDVSFVLQSGYALILTIYVDLDGTRYYMSCPANRYMPYSSDNDLVLEAG